MGFTTTNTYDGNLLSTTTPAPDASHAGSTTLFSYDTKGEVVRGTDPRNNATTIAYIGAGLVSNITDAQDNVISFQYDLRANRTSLKEALKNATALTYNARNRLTTFLVRTKASFNLLMIRGAGEPRSLTAMVKPPPLATTTPTTLSASRTTQAWAA